MKATDYHVPVGRALSLKLFASYVVLILVTVLTALFVHHQNVRNHMVQLSEEECTEIAKDTAIQVRDLLAQGGHRDLSLQLQEVRQSTRYLVNFVGFKQDLQGLTPPFQFSSEEQAHLQEGAILVGDAAGRVEHVPRAQHRWRRGPRFKPGRDRKFVLGRFVAAPVSLEGENVGAVAVYYSRPDFTARAQRAATSIVNSLVVALSLALLLASLLAGSLTRPLRRMRETAEWFGRGEFSARTGLNRNDELGVLARAFDDMASELEANAATRTRLLSDVSHELGTPITTIRATLEAVLDGVVSPDEQRQYLQSLLHQLEHLGDIVNDVTELSRFETGQITICQEVFRADIPVLRAAESATVLASRKKVTVRVPDEAPDLKVVGDPRRITQVVKNLLLNAVQHNPDSTTVKLFWRIDEASVTFVVSDDGPGIAEEDAKRLFDRFYKASESRTRDDSGSGLGLAICKQILKAHGSEIVFANSDEGKSFAFTLPRAD